MTELPAKIASLCHRIEKEYGWIGVSKDTLTELLDIADEYLDRQGADDELR